MAPAERRSAPERRQEILAASLDLFARHGVHGVTTRMIADAAGISEALLYRHFKSKDDLYSELQRWCMRATSGVAEKLSQMEPGTHALVLATYFIVRQILGTRDDERCCLKRLMLGSLIADGEFARGFVKSNFARFVPKLVECVDAARRAGDLQDRGHHGHLRIWFVHHLAVMASNMQLPDKPVVDYGVRQDQLIEELTRFGLRGIGLTEDAIAKHFAPKTMSAILGSLLDPSVQRDQTTTRGPAPGAKESKRQ